jgi:hypothetical protein
LQEFFEMDAELGSVVVDKEGEKLGTVDYVIRNSWTGEISKYIIYRKPPELDISFVPEDILEVKDSKTKVDLSGK